MSMTKRERLQTTFAGEQVDRPAVALWRHWPGDDQRAEDQARAHLEFQRQYDWDFIKVTPSSGFTVEDWGVTEKYLGNCEGTAEHGRLAISKPGDWLMLPVLDPRQGALGRQLRCLGLIAQEAGDVPFIQTVFNPLSVAKYLAGEDILLIHLRRYPEQVHTALRTITASITAFVREVMRSGAAGIFFAVQHAQYGILSETEYRTFGRPYDLQVLEAAQSAWFNLLHLHGSDVMFDLLADYPVQVINWHDRETPPSLGDALKRTERAVCGGWRQWDTVVRGSPDDVRAEARDAIQAASGRRIILGTGCVTPIVAPTSNLKAAREVAG
ncbi:MAG: uroporphyrinogen decarboxylase [Chloroflexi bacterium]|nr:uroporphyrinogen decarboxylase [Chloroflexota bacterium]